MKHIWWLSAHAAWLHKRTTLFCPKPFLKRPYLNRRTLCVISDQVTLVHMYEQHCRLSTVTDLCHIHSSPLTKRPCHDHAASLKLPLFVPFQKPVAVVGSDLTLQLNNLMFYICRISKKDRMIKNLSKTAFHNLYKASPNSINHRIKRFYKGVWGIRLPRHLLTVCSCGCFDLQCVSVKFKCLQTHNTTTLMLYINTRKT